MARLARRSSTPSTVRQRSAGFRKGRQAVLSRHCGLAAKRARSLRSSRGGHDAAVSSCRIRQSVGGDYRFALEHEGSVSARRTPPLERQHEPGADGRWLRSTNRGAGAPSAPAPASTDAVPPPLRRGSDGESAASFLHRRQRGLRFRERTRAEIDARGLGRDRDLFAVAGLRPLRAFCAGFTRTVSCTRPPIRTFCALPSCSSTISSSTPSRRFASARLISAWSATALASWSG